MAHRSAPRHDRGTRRRDRPASAAPDQAGGGPYPLCPVPAAPLPAVKLRSATRYPLIYRKRIARVENSARPGGWVAVYGPDDVLLGYGFYNPRSEVAVRLIRDGPELPDESFWDQRLRAAVELRTRILRLDQHTNACRLVHAEADGLSGLVVDQFANVLSAEAFSLGMYVRAEALVRKLAALRGAAHYIIRTSPAFASQEGSAPRGRRGGKPQAVDEGEAAHDGLLQSPELPQSVVIHEYGTRFRVQLAGGHKTGFFCDQRENRRKLAELCGGKSVLDICCYTGGFAIQAKKLGGAADVTAVDLDEAPLKLARENAHLNQVRINFAQADAFGYMRDMLRNGRQYDVVVLDPPKLIRSRDEMDEGSRKHFDLNRLAIRLVRPGGILLTCTCSGLLGEAEFLRLVFAAARGAGSADEAAAGQRPRGRVLQVFLKTGAAGDHPVSSWCPETEYLKAIWARVE